jgi:hypothetical protein
MNPSRNDESTTQIRGSETTTPYALANYAYSPGYYSHSLIKCSNEYLNGKTINIICMRERIEVPCDQDLFQNDVAHIKCKVGYVYPRNGIIKSEIECLPNGKWSGAVFECNPDCGRTTKKSKPLIVNGIDANASDFPWNAAIYLQTTLICGGSVITERIVLSAGKKFTH